MRFFSSYSICIFIFLLISCPAVKQPVPTSSPPVTGVRAVSANGVTWHFDGLYAVGQYCSGDWWVVDPGSGVGLSSTSHDPSDGQTLAGEVSMLNPGPLYQDYEERAAYTYPVWPVRVEPLSLRTTLPLTLNAGDSLVTAVRYAEQVSDNDSPHKNCWIRSMGILTVVDEAQPADAFRPPYCRPTRIAASAEDPLAFRLSDVKAAFLPSLPRLARAGIDQIPDIEATIQKLKGPWIDHFGGNSWAGDLHPASQMPSYGAFLSLVVSEAATQLCLDYPDDQLLRLSVALTQIGVDNYGILLAGGRWPGTGGINSGRKFPIVFASVMLGDTRMQAFPRLYVQETAQLFAFQEDTQTYYFDDPSLPLYMGPAPGYAPHTDAAADSFPLRGQTGWVGLAGVGEGDIALWRITEARPHEHIPVEDWDDDWSVGNLYQGWSENYRIGSSASAWIGQALFMLLFPDTEGGGPNDMVRVWDHPAYFDYAFRWMNQDYSAARTRFLARFGGGIGFQQNPGMPFIGAVWAAGKSRFQTGFRTQP